MSIALTPLTHSHRPVSALHVRGAVGAYLPVASDYSGIFVVWCILCVRGARGPREQQHQQRQTRGGGQ